MAFLQSPAPRQPVFHTPMVVPLLIALLTAAHVARWLASPEQSLAWINRFGFIPARYSPAFLSQYGIDPGSVWERALPFVTYMGLHGDFTHLAINCLWLLAFGPVVARRFGTLPFLLFFVLCGIAGAATHLAFHWGDLGPVVGASGAISGLMAAALRLLPTDRPVWVADAGRGPMAPILSRAFLSFSLVWVVINVATGLTGFSMGGPVGLTAWQAHLGGFAAGLLLSGPFDRLSARLSA